jgi:hypothetical protein
MSELVSTTVGNCWLGYAALSPYARAGSAVSSEAQMVSKAASAVVNCAERSQALFGDKTAAISELMTLANECAKVDWDGNGASAIRSTAVSRAMDFIRALPRDVPLPEFASEPDGSVSLDWIQSRHRIFSVSAGEGNRLAYAWLDGADQGHGVARFDGQFVPPRILEGILSIVDHGKTFLWSA